MRKIINLIGRRFGRLEVKARAPNKGPYTCWWCQCSCGNPELKAVMSKDLNVGDTKSCGCLARESRETAPSTKAKISKTLRQLYASGAIRKVKRFTHGDSDSLTYSTWVNMKDRCYNKNAINYSSYGGRGIEVCDRWLEKGTGYQNFLADMGPRPSKDHCIDRIDPLGNYEPSNCRWVTKSFNARRAAKSCLK